MAASTAAVRWPGHAALLIVTGVLASWSGGCRPQATVADASYEPTPMIASPTSDGGTEDAAAPSCGARGATDPSDSMGDTGTWPETWASRERRVIELVNARRQEGACCGREGCFLSASPLQLDVVLRNAARAHAEDMEREGYFAHESLDGRTPADRVQAAGFDGCLVGENIARGLEPPETIVESWMVSDEHCANIMWPDFTQLGVGYYEGADGVWVQDFGG